jgi:mono/diheme cytochrome c family protein
MRFKTLRFGNACAALVFAAWSHSAVSAQTTGPKNPPLVIASMYGRDLFEFYCASCHGRDGKGGGPAAAALKAPPADLTALARQNGGTFPRARVEAFVTGNEDQPAPAHGSRAMPVWGPIFKGLDPHDTANKRRIANIVDYIESLQTR